MWWNVNDARKDFLSTIQSIDYILPSLHLISGDERERIFLIHHGFMKEFSLFIALHPEHCGARSNSFMKNWVTWMKITYCMRWVIYVRGESKRDESLSLMFI